MNFGNTPTVRTSIIIDPITGDIASPVNGQIWYNNTSGKFRKRENGVTTDLDTGGSGSGLSFTEIMRIQTIFNN